MALSGGPSLIFAPGPMSWQGEHNRLNTCSPAAASCANVMPVEAVSAIPAITHIFILFFSSSVAVVITGDSLDRQCIPCWHRQMTNRARHYRRCFGVVLCV
jgi:hypothetical protein